MEAEKVGAQKQEDKYRVAETQRDIYVNAILETKSDKKIVVAGPGTGKTYLFKKILEGKTQTLTLSFVNSLVEDLALELYGLSKVRTLHSFGRSILASILQKKIDIYPKLSKIIKEDYRILKGGNADFDELFHKRDDGNDLLSFYESRRQYYKYYGFTDVIFTAVKLLEADKSKIPAYEQVLIDEFQDFNNLEVSLIDLLAEKSPLLIAGDDDQALYEFLKHASADHIRDRNGNEQYAAFNLPFCARCPEVIVNATNDLIEGAKKEAFLKERINKPYKYLPTKEKDKVGIDFPKITYATYYSKQIPWFIEKSIAEIAALVKGKFTVLIITATNTQVRLIAEALQEKGLVNIDYPVTTSESEVNLYDGFNLLLNNRKDNLGWRIISSLLMNAEDFSDLIKKTETDSSKIIPEYLDKEFVKSILQTRKALAQVMKKETITSELFNETLKRFGIKTDDIASEYLVNKIEALNPATGNPAIKHIPIKATTVQSSKGLSADVVFIANFDDKYFLKDGKNVTDQDICNFLVALTRTKKKAFLISTDKKSSPSLLKWISNDKLEIAK